MEHLVKILKQVEYESARRKKNVNEKQDTERNKLLHSLFSHLFLWNSRELKGTHLNSFEPKELKGTWGNSKEVKGSHLNSFEPKEIKETQGHSFELIWTQGNLRELKGTQGNSRELKGIQGNSTKGKKLQKSPKTGEGRKIDNFTDIKKRLGLRHERLKSGTFYW